MSGRSFRTLGNSRVQSPIAAALVVLLTVTAAQAQQQQTQQGEVPDQLPPFRIRVIEGEGAINNIRQAVNRGASVVVEDENHNPLSGVSVTFFLPNDGPSGLFPNGSRVLSVFTDDKGVASSRGLRFNNQVGLMKVGVVASLFSQTVNATITQTNISSASSVKSSYVPAIGMPKSSVRGSSKKWIIILAVAGAGAGVGIYFATKKGPPNASISIGAPTAGTPFSIGAR